MNRILVLFCGVLVATADFVVVLEKDTNQKLPTSVTLQEIVETHTSIVVEIDTHYAVTTFTRTFENRNDDSIQVPFEVTIPDTAFISKFQMETGGRAFVGVVLTRSEADEAYEEAVEQDDTAGRVSRSSEEDDENTYDVSLNVGPGSTVTFALSYDQLLARRLGWLELSDLKFESELCESKRDNSTCTSLARQNPVPVEIYITEPEGISDVEIVYPPAPNAQIDISGTTAKVTMALQESFILSLRYETDRSDISTFVIDPNRDYFVHLFSPPNLNPLLKAIVFVLDKSGSMSGSPYAMLKQAAEVIINSLKPSEYLTIVVFDDVITPLTEDLLPATPENKAFLLEKLLQTFANGLTDINGALLQAIDMLKQFKANTQETYAHEIIFLTDGVSTTGVTRDVQIRENIRTANTEDFPIFSVGLGGIDFSLIRQIALESGGFERVIEDSTNVFDGLTGLFEEINQVLLSDIDISYVSDFGKIEKVTDVRKTLFEGSELLIAGRIPDGTTSVTVVATGHNERGDVIDFGGRFDLDDLIDKYNDMRSGLADDVIPSFEVAKVWAILRLRDLQIEIDLMEGIGAEEDEVAPFIEEATNIALQYQIVTEYTSIFVVEQEDFDRCGDSDDFRVCIYEDDRKGHSGQSKGRKTTDGGKRFTKSAPIVGFFDGVCAEHVFCDQYSYCDSFGACLPCIDCWIYRDAFAGADCPECLQCAPDASIREITRSSEAYTVVYCNEGDSMSTVDIDLVVKSDAGFEYETQVPVPEIGSCDSVKIECEILGDINCEGHLTVTAIAHFQSIYCEVPAENDEKSVAFRRIGDSHSSSTYISTSADSPSTSTDSD